MKCYSTRLEMATTEHPAILEAEKTSDGPVRTKVFESMQFSNKLSSEEKNIWNIREGMNIDFGTDELADPSIGYIDH